MDILELLDDDLELDQIALKLEESYDEEEDEKQDPDQPHNEHLETLKKCFGHRSFRPFQWEIINAIISKRDVCAIMATGHGKSLCFQFPAVYLGGITLVISPLISLMEDQILSLNVSNIPAVLLGTAQKNSAKALNDIFNDVYSIVYLTPEYATGDYGKDMMTKLSKKNAITLIAVDEAHCISSWGHDFRESYRNLGCLKTIFPNIPILAATATATEQVRNDIQTSLHLKDPLLVSSGFDRPNLYFDVRFKGASVYDDLKSVMQFGESGWKFSGPTIIYCIRRKDTEDVASLLKLKGINALPYHAGLALNVRKEAHERFVKDKVDVIVGTIAFGMGIDKPDIRNVIHYGCSKSLEGYYQEVGRAGRDGQLASCTCFFNAFDFMLHRQIGASKNNKNNNFNEEALQIMENFLYDTSKCRREYILEHFGEKNYDKTKKPINCCNNCKSKDTRSNTEKYKGLDENGKYNFTEDAEKFLKTVQIMKGLYGINMYISSLRGSVSSKLPKRFHSSALHGCGISKTEAWWKSVAEMLIQEKYLKRKSLRYTTHVATTVELTETGKSFLENLKANPTNTTLRLKPHPSLLSLLKPKEIEQTTPRPAVINNQKKIIEPSAEQEKKMILFNKLLDMRKQIAEERNCAPHNVASNTALMKLARNKPVNLKQLRNLNLDSFNENKIIMFGERFLRVIYPEMKNFESNEKSDIKDLLVLNPMKNIGIMSKVAEQTCSLFLSGFTVPEIAKERGMIPDAILSQLVSGIKVGYPIKMVDLGVTDEIKEKIMNTLSAFDDIESIQLKKIKDVLPEVSYDDIKVVVAYYQVRCHLKNLNLTYEEFEDFSFVKPKSDEEQALLDFEQELIENTEFMPDDNISIRTFKINEGASSSKSENIECISLLDAENVLNVGTKSLNGEIIEPPVKKSKTESISILLDSPPRTKNNSFYELPTQRLDTDFFLESPPRSLHHPRNGNQNEHLPLPVWLPSNFN